jgi:hypothetical protein
VSSTIITASAPSGRGAPVVIRAIWPDLRGSGVDAEACEICVTGYVPSPSEAAISKIWEWSR